MFQTTTKGLETHLKRKKRGLFGPPFHFVPRPASIPHAAEPGANAVGVRRRVVQVAVAQPLAEQPGLATLDGKRVTAGDTFPGGRARRRIVSNQRKRRPAKAAFRMLGGSLACLSPEILETVWRKLGVLHCVLDVLVPKIGLQRSGIVTVVRQLVAASMSQHVRVNLEAEPGFDTGALDHLGKARLRKRRAALGQEHEIAVRRFPPELAKTQGQRGLRLALERSEVAAHQVILNKAELSDSNAELPCKPRTAGAAQ
jgi:hypothetical protein